MNCFVDFVILQIIFNKPQFFSYDIRFYTTLSESILPKYEYL